jgi:hypothetical protein
MLELLSMYTSVGELSVDEFDPDMLDARPATVVAFICHIAVGHNIRARCFSIKNLHKDIN